MPESRALSAMLADLRAMLENPSRLDQPEERFRLMHTFERKLSSLNEPPAAVVDDDRVGKVARLLWQKVHPEQADLDSILGAIADADAFVRSTAAAALGASLERQIEPQLDENSLYRARTVLEQQRYREHSRTIAVQLDQLIDELKSAVSSAASAEPHKARNPYVAGPPLRDGRWFLGREGVLDDLRLALGEGSGTRGVVIHGGRRTGKTSLLYRIREGALGEGFLPIYFDMQSVVTRPLESFLGALVHAIGQAHEAAGSQAGDDPTPPPADFDRLRATVRKAIAGAGQQMLVLMFDEYEVFKDYLGDGSVARQLQSLLEQERALIFIFAGAQKVESLKERNFQLLLDDCIYRKISFLSSRDARRLVLEPARGLIEFADEEADRIVALTAGHPFYTQALCWVVFDELQRDERTRVTREDVERAVTRFVENPAPHLVLGWNALTFDQKIAASAAAMLQSDGNTWLTPDSLVGALVKERFPIRVTRGEMHQALTVLREEDWVAKREGDNSFRLTMDLVRRWIAECRSVWYLVDEQRRSLVDRAADVARRSWSALIDVACLGLLTAFTIDLFERSYFLLAIVYPVLFVTLFHATPGMLLMRVRVVSETGVWLPAVRAVTLGMLMASPLFVLGLAVVAPRGPTSVLLSLLGLAILVLHASMVHFGRKKRGLYDKIAGAIFVVQPRG